MAVCRKPLTGPTIDERYKPCINALYVRNGLGIYTCVSKDSCTVQVLPAIDTARRVVTLYMVENSTVISTPVSVQVFQVQNPTLLLTCPSGETRLSLPGIWTVKLVVYR